jgi:hypothetical protein
MTDQTKALDAACAALVSEAKVDLYNHSIAMDFEGGTLTPSGDSIGTNRSPHKSCGNRRKSLRGIRHKSLE